MDVEIGRVHSAAAGGHQSAGAVAGGFDHGIGDIDGGALAVAEDGVGMGTVSVDDQLPQLQHGTVRGKDSAVGAVEIGLVAGSFTGLDHSDITVGCFLPGNTDSVTAVLVVGQGLVDGDIFSGRICRGGNCGRFRRFCRRLRGRAFFRLDASAQPQAQQERHGGKKSRRLFGLFMHCWIILSSMNC